MSFSTCIQCKKSHADANSPWCIPCNAELNEWTDKWEGRPNQSKDEKLTTAKRNEDSGPTILNGEPRSVRDAKPITIKIQKAPEPGAASSTTQTKKNEINSGPSGRAEIRSASLNTNETTTERMPIVSENSSMLPAISETQAEAYSENSKNLNEEIYRSINLLSRSEQELFDSMKGLRAHQPETTIRLYDPERVQTAVMCGRQIVDSMKAKLELIKFSNKLGRAK